MKAIVGALLFLCFSVQSSWSASIGDLLDDIRQETRLAIGNNGTAAWYHDWRSGQQGFGLSTEIFTYRYFSANGGYFTMLDAGLKGTAVLGGSLHLDRLLVQIVPNGVELMKLFVPQSMEKFFSRLSLGVFFGYNFSRNDTAIGISSGLEFSL